MQVARPAILSIELRERPQFSLQRLLSGAEAEGFDVRWFALAPHLGHEVELERGDLEVFESIAPGGSVARETLVESFGETRISRLLEAGVLIGDHVAHEELRANNARIVACGWWPPAAIAHSLGRWQGVDVAIDEEREGRRNMSRLIALHGLPPTESVAVRGREAWLALHAPAKTELDDLLARRTTCRNFDLDFVLPARDLATTLHRVFGAQARHELAPGASMLKKNSPSGGGLHPVEAYLLVQRVEDLPPGLYHYQCMEHVLEPMRSLSEAEAGELAHELVAGQPWFAGAPVLLLMAARFARTFWKYPNHAKAWKVIQLDAGHLSQNLYLSATEMDYGAFITGAINDECAERLFELDGLAEGAVAVCGFGKRVAGGNFEFDPLGKAPA